MAMELARRDEVAVSVAVPPAVNPADVAVQCDGVGAKRIGLVPAIDLVCNRVAEHTAYDRTADNGRGVAVTGNRAEYSAGQRTENRKAHAAARPRMQSSGDAGNADDQHFDDQSVPVAGAVANLRRNCGDVPYPRDYQDRECYPCDLVEAPGGRPGHLSAETAQGRDQSG